MGKNSKDKRDVYNRLAKESNWRARSVFKLLQVNEEMHILDNATHVVDLCAAPGSWSQALQQILSANSDNYKIVSVDLQKIEPIEGVVTLIGDITKESTAKEIIANFGGELADVVVCDGAADITGIHSLDESFHYFIFTAALAITSHLLTDGGHFVIKIFKGIHSNSIVKQLIRIFEEVRIIKPLASRATSAEAFLVAKNYRPPKFFKADLAQPDKLLLPTNVKYNDLFPNEKKEIDKAARVLKFVMHGGYAIDKEDSDYNKEIDQFSPDINLYCMMNRKFNKSNLKSNNNDDLGMNVNSCISDIRKQSIEMAINMNNEQIDTDEYSEFFSTLLNNSNNF